MTGKNENCVKVLFRFYSNIFEEEMVETMWAETIDSDRGLYRLDNIPFYATDVASDDIVFAEFDETEQMLTFRKTVQYSGNSVVQVVLMNETWGINKVRNIFEELGCVSEKVNEGYFSMEIPASIDYKPIKAKLDEMEADEVIGYAEPCLAEGHRQ